MCLLITIISNFFNGMPGSRTPAAGLFQIALLPSLRAGWALYKPHPWGPTPRFLPPMCSYGQHAPSSSFQQDSALVAQFVSQRSDVSEEYTTWNDALSYESRPKKLTLGQLVYKEDVSAVTNERAPLLPKPSVTRITEAYEGSDDHSNHDRDYRHIFLDEVKTLSRYTLPVFG